MTFYSIAADLISEYEQTLFLDVSTCPDDALFVADFIAEIPLPAASARTSLIRSLLDVLEQCFAYDAVASDLPGTLKKLIADGDRRDFSVSRFDRWLARPKAQRPLFQ